MSKLSWIAIIGVVGVALLVMFPSLRRGFSELSPFGFRSEPLVVQTTSGDGRIVEQEMELVTLLGFDAIPAITDPSFVAAEHAEGWMDADELVVGLSINGERRAYPIKILSRHEIVNDDVGGVPVAVTW